MNKYLPSQFQSFPSPACVHLAGPVVVVVVIPVVMVVVVELGVDGVAMVVVAVQITFPETAPIIAFILVYADLQKQFPHDCPDWGVNVK